MAALVRNVVNWSHRNRAPTADLCETCGKKPKFVDKDGTHPYCSRSCARSAGGPGSTSLVACVLRGCRATGKPAFANFCSEVHAKEGVRLGQVEGCELCSAQPRIVGTMCIACDRLVRAGSRLRELAADGTSFKNIRAQFLSEWEGRQAPRLEKVYEVVLPRDVRANHEQYRLSRPALRDIRTFHSAQCICDLGTKDAVVCSFKSCGICSVVKSGFKTFAFGETSNQGRFGEGIYSYKNPAIVDQLYATSCTTSPFRVMIACDTSVDAGHCNSDEAKNESLFVPSAEAILPVYILMYAV